MRRLHVFECGATSICQAKRRWQRGNQGAVKHRNGPGVSTGRWFWAVATVLFAALTLTSAGGPMPAGRMALGNGNPAAVSVTERAGCRTVVGVAHEDDDLLFISPRVTQLVKRKCPVQVVYLTAGNDGRPAGLGSFAARRETGAQRAYTRMVLTAENWALAPLQLGADRIPSYTPRSGGGDIRLTFLRLPDGLPTGDGSVLNRHQSLLRLFRGEITSMDAVDSSRSYDEKRLVATLSWIMEQWQADEVLTLDYDNVKFGGPRKRRQTTATMEFPHAISAVPRTLCGPGHGSARTSAI